MASTEKADPEAELDCAQLGALIRRMDWATLIVRGPDRQTWLNGLVTCDLAPKKPGEGAYGLIVAKNGRVSAEVHILLGEDVIRIGVPPAKAEGLVATLDRYLVMEDATIEVEPSGTDWMLALGLRAPDAAAAARAAGAEAALTQRGGLPTAIVAAPTSRSSEVEDAIIAAAAPSRVASPAGWERVRVEHAIPEYGVDFDDEVYPQEASLERDGVSFSKGCYLGQEVVFMLEKRGHVKRRLIQLSIAGTAQVGDAITTPDGETVGAITSYVERPPMSLALGYVKYKHARAETELSVGAAASAKVTSVLAITDDEG